MITQICCPHCQKFFFIDEQFLGQDVRCNQCGNAFGTVAPVRPMEPHVPPLAAPVMGPLEPKVPPARRSAPTSDNAFVFTPEPAKVEPPMPPLTAPGIGTPELRVPPARHSAPASDNVFAFPPDPPSAAPPGNRSSARSQSKPLPAKGSRPSVIRYKSEAMQAASVKPNPYRKIWLIAAAIAGSTAVTGMAIGLVISWYSNPKQRQAPTGSALTQKTDLGRPKDTRPELLATQTVIPGTDGQLTEEMKTYLKELTVFVKVEVGERGGSGSGFLFKRDDGNGIGYIATNEHVANPKFGPKDRKANVDANAKITVVFNSGIRGKERSYPAEILGLDADYDLAILKIKASNLPRPLLLDAEPEVSETQPVYVLGFPFGKKLAIGTANPEVNIGKASISAIRRNDKGEMIRLQLEGIINPGNSGGPVVDSRGSLVGVTVAGYDGTQIWLAILPQLLDNMVYRLKIR
jgi:S1-C subfamily serine protease